MENPTFGNEQTRVQRPEGELTSVANNVERIERA